MDGPAGVTRVIVVIVDGLRADAIPLYRLRALERLAAQGAATMTARTVTPSVTAAAMTSLLTGVSPQVHGMVSERFGIPRRTESLEPLPGWLRRHGVPTFGFMAALPFGFRGIGRRIARHLDATISFGGGGGSAILDGMLASLERHRRGFWLGHWPDADVVGHREGWLSPAYWRVSRELDRAVARLVRETGLLHDPETVLIVAADHGGGGRRSHHHDSGHPLDTRIPLIVTGGGVVPGPLVAPCSLLDISATVPWLLGAGVPEGYQGRVLAEAFRTTMAPATVARAAA